MLSLKHCSAPRKEKKNIRRHTKDDGKQDISFKGMVQGRITFVSGHIDSFESDIPLSMFTLYDPDTF